MDVFKQLACILILSVLLTIFYFRKYFNSNTIFINIKQDLTVSKSLYLSHLPSLYVSAGFVVFYEIKEISFKTNCGDIKVMI